ncbi:hypothetical protein CDAR_123061 [Caerostris darwini]|uniref:Uncharacterized protein n=1 Tax=Caerostris darwini TaxID=1538125 RepID=A0AAV4X9W4_9ARAC|nr:hypothetical protein CDAR_123061 [Caerostris darwini]
MSIICGHALITTIHQPGPTQYRLLRSPDYSEWGLLLMAIADAITVCQLRIRTGDDAPVDSWVTRPPAGEKDEFLM